MRKNLHLSIGFLLLISAIISSVRLGRLYFLPGYFQYNEYFLIYFLISLINLTTIILLFFPIKKNVQYVVIALGLIITAYESRFLIDNIRYILTFDFEFINNYMRSLFQLSLNLIYVFVIYALLSRKQKFINVGFYIIIILLLFNILNNLILQGFYSGYNIENILYDLSYLISFRGYMLMLLFNFNRFELNNSTKQQKTLNISHKKLNEINPIDSNKDRSNIEDKLNQLNILLQKELITKEEYVNKRKQILEKY